MKSLLRLRNQIDRLDDRIVGLLNQRLGLAEKIGGLKLINGERIYSQQREQEVFTRLISKRTGYLTPMEIRSIYRQILLASRAHQKRVIQQGKRKRSYKH